jgi:hypothetical protein
MSERLARGRASRQRALQAGRQCRACHPAHGGAYPMREMNRRDGNMRCMHAIVKRTGSFQTAGPDDGGAAVGASGGWMRRMEGKRADMNLRGSR